MTEKFLTVLRASGSSLQARVLMRRFRFSFFAMCLVPVGPALMAQTPSASSVEVNPAAAAGMTSGTSSRLSSGMTAREVELMRVRTEAQAIEGEAVAASMARNADRSMEDQSRQRTLQTAREEKAIKRSMAERMKWEQANDRSNSRVNKVSANDMSAWNTDSGSVRVERNVPDPFILSLIEEERQRSAREAAENAGKRDFNPLAALNPVSATKKALSWRPFQGGDDSSSSEVTTAIMAAGSASPGLPADGSSQGANPATAEPQFAQTSSRSSATPAPQLASHSSSPAGSVPRISGAALVDGRSTVNRTEDARQETGNSPGNSAVLSQPAGVSADLPGDGNDEGGGFFSRLIPGNSSRSAGGSSRSNSGGGLFSFGRNKEPAPQAGSIDASLFPAGSASSTPTGGSLGGGYTADSSARDSEFASASTGEFQLPGEAEEPERRGFSIPKPSLSIPSLSVPGLGSSDGSGGGSNVPTMTTTNSSGTNIYVVTSAAQFLVYGADRMQSEVRSLPAGTVVRMTKPGEQWASVQVPGGAEGVVQNKFLRAASAAESGGQFAPSE